MSNNTNYSPMNSAAQAVPTLIITQAVALIAPWLIRHGLDTGNVAQWATEAVAVVATAWHFINDYRANNKAPTK